MTSSFLNLTLKKSGIIHEAIKYSSNAINLILEIHQSVPSIIQTMSNYLDFMDKYEHLLE
jgi:hypothetical protein